MIDIEKKNNDIINALSSEYEKYLHKNNISQKEVTWYVKNKTKREKDGKLELCEHIRGLIYSLLSAGRSWDDLEKKAAPDNNGNLTKIDSIFENYDVDKIIYQLKNDKKKYGSDNSAVKKYKYYELLTNDENKLGNRRLFKQILRLQENIENIQSAYSKYNGFSHIDDLYNNYICNHSIKQLVKEIAGGKFKLYEVGVPLASEYLRNVGFDLPKPDVHVVRILSERRLGYLEPVKAKNPTMKQLYNVFDIVKHISDTTGKSQEYIDMLLWNYCADNKMEICTSNPKEKCKNECVIYKNNKQYCNYPHK